MLEMKYTDTETTYTVEFSAVSQNVVELKGEFPIKTSGFTLSRPNMDDDWDYGAYATIYREIEGGAQFSNDESVYVEPEPMPSVPTLDEFKAAKIAEMNAAQQEIIKHGVEVTLSDGTKERFTLKDQDQLSLMGLQTLAERGDNQIPWHDADNAQHCKYYTAEDIKRITAAAMALISYQVTYYRDLRIYINSMTDRATVESVEYGVYIPSEYQSEVLADFYAAQNA